MRHLALATCMACGGSAELGKPNDPPEWPMGAVLGAPPPAPPPAPVDTDVTGGPEVSAPPPAPDAPGVEEVE